MNFNHFDERGNAVMVDVSAKQPTMRTAVAEALVQMSSELVAAIQAGGVAKGDVLGVARLAGIQAAKRTPELIPLSHPLALHAVFVDFEPNAASGRIMVKCTVRAFERTGVEMEAMTGASLAALTIYDMCKGSDKSIAIGHIRLLYKEGGKSGIYRREADKREDQP
ncbi:cyclic pyranopterin monophosphate synthase MoaC [Geobacter sp. SVR]|uniref:cyclic pyranopterin monophosphate synthase MoaC n=1 Tax=Geobacter sp. SVR TaxID=2495594 RepID=UPI00143F0101|nr:cyclic pyranopterin monophosphate synthase MoaC [Geobacter sp. SVR]BCS55648.1 cyclic pyranopterin monophosphate synthase accessory protein [Geobacter sp. SVR]GCF83652.1 cyclic pyranopterin monophosphate synthase accessory protein [Geobacter sp. SVR]